MKTEVGLEEMKGDEMQRKIDDVRGLRKLKVAKLSLLN